MSKFLCKNEGGYKHKIAGEGLSEVIISDMAAQDTKQEHFNPTDILAAALAACTSSMMAHMAMQRKEDFTGSELEIEKFFDSKANAITKFIMKIRFSPNITEETKKICINAAMVCPVHKSITKEIPIELTEA